MEGIEILNKTSVNSIVWLYVAIWAVLILGCYGLYMLFDKKGKETWCLITFFVGLAILILGIVFSDKINTPSGKYTYQVTISQEASLVDFYEQYTVVSHEGDLWTIQDK